MHHDVRINDKALVDTAVAADHCIAEHRLPDTAIDMVVWAVAKLKMEVTARP